MLATTFYSFKGGVGRTMLAVNVAGILAEAGQRVLLVDFDLEAPGLSYLPELRSKASGKLLRGVAGFLADSWKTGQTQDSTRYVLPSVGPDDRLAFMPAGDVDGEQFTRDMESLHSAEFFNFGRHQHGGVDRLSLFHDLRRQWALDYDYVLIDSRTGFTDVGGICTRLLPDVVVAVMTLAEQGLKGVQRVLSQIGDESLYGHKIKKHVAISMVPTDQREKVEPRISKFSEALGVPVKQFTRLWLIPSLLVREDPFYFRTTTEPDQLQTAYRQMAELLREANDWDVEFRLDRGRAALTEHGDASPAERLIQDLLNKEHRVPTTRALGAITDAATMIARAPGTHGVGGRRQGLMFPVTFPITFAPGTRDVRARRQRVATNALESALARFEAPTTQRAEALSSLAYMLAGQGTASPRRLEDAKRWYLEALAIHRQLKDQPGEARTLQELGAVAVTQRQFNEAEPLYREALATSQRLGDLAGEAEAWHQLGIIAASEHRYVEADQLLERGLAIRRSQGDRSGEARALHQLGAIAAAKRQYDAAERLYREALAASERVRDEVERAKILYRLALLAEARRDSEGAQRLYRESQTVSERIGDDRRWVTEMIGSSDQLTERELEVLRRLSSITSLSEIARELQISQSLVSSILARIMSKLGVRTRAEVVPAAILRGLLEEASTRPSQLFGVTTAPVVINEDGAVWLALLVRNQSDQAAFGCTAQLRSYRLTSNGDQKQQPQVTPGHPFAWSTATGDVGRIRTDIPPYGEDVLDLAFTRGDDRNVVELSGRNPASHGYEGILARGVGTYVLVVDIAALSSDVLPTRVTVPFHFGGSSDLIFAGTIKVEPVTAELERVP